MFDSYCLNSYQKELVINSLEDAMLIASKFYGAYGFRMDDFFKKSKSGRPNRTIGKTNICELRKVVTHFFSTESYLELKQIAKLIGVQDHSSVIYYKKQGQAHCETHDPRFKQYYESFLRIMDFS